jgi:hypothetical protein
MVIATTALAALIVAALTGGAAQAQPGQSTAGPACRATDVAKSLDFWVGDWQVSVGSQFAGHDLVTPILSGCAIVEDWTDADGSHGQSLFAYDARKDYWTQTWVTDRTNMPGGIKYKRLQAHGPGTTTFAGEIEGQSGAIFYDRTILTAMPDGSVRQQIQVSRDGISWRTGFDAIYRRTASATRKP